MMFRDSASLFLSSMPDENKKKYVLFKYTNVIISHVVR